jgi:hypothetical protein
MSIRKNNYEAWFLDFHEGNLDEDQKQQLLSFLEEHPELREELDAFDNNLFLDSDSVFFEGKNKLKANCETFDDLLISYTEGLLNSSEKAAAEKLVKENPSLAADLETYEKLKLKPDVLFVFTDKNKLKKGRVIRLLPVFRMAAAALLLLVTMKLWPVFFMQEGVDIKTITASDTAAVKSERKTVKVINSMQPEEKPAIADQIKQEKAQNKPAEKTPKKNLKQPQINFDSDADLNAHSGFQEEVPAEEFIADNTSVFIKRKEEKNEDETEKDFPSTAAAHKKSEYPAIKELIAARIKRAGNKTSHQKSEEEKIDVLDIADAGIAGIARLTGKDIRFYRRTDKEGRTSGFALTAGRFEFSRSVSRSTKD